MPNPNTDSPATAAGRGAVAGLLGVGAMTAFQLLVEMPVTGRGESYAPASLVERLLPVAPKSRRGRRRLNYEIDDDEHSASSPMRTRSRAGHGISFSRVSTRSRSSV